MAKSKNAAALFEVIQSSRFPNRPDPLRTPRWWFKRRDADAEPPISISHEHIAPDPEPVATTLTTAPPAISPAIVPADSATVSSPGIYAARFSALVFSASAFLHKVFSPKAASPHASRSSSKLPIPGVDLQLDPDNHEITVKVSYYAAIISAFTVLVIIGLAYAIGAKMHHAPLAATSSPSSEQLRARPAHPEVLDVGTGGASHAPPLLAKRTDDSAQTASDRQAGKSVPGNAPPSSPASVDAQRVIGRQYVVIQSYPEEKSADDAAALLNKNNVPCTVEKALANWTRSDWYSVVGTTGFDRIRGNGDYASYETSINRVSDQFAGNLKFKKFEPHPYRWKGTSGTAVAEPSHPAT